MLLLGLFLGLHRYGERCEGGTPRGLTLSRYWQWLHRRHEVEANVWKGVVLPEPRVSDVEKERPFTEAELQTLLSGPATERMHDLMRMGALTGSRIDPIVCLRVKDCENDTFRFKPQKREPGPRLCPIHPDLQRIVARRCEGKHPDDDLFPEWPYLNSKDGQREKSSKASEEFTRYRRRVGVDDVIPGNRRARVNFHSFRRWFATEAERADQPPHIISAVIGHRDGRAGTTLSVYSSGPKLEQARRCVEAVRLPSS
ncbi:tyrosine-type recombinase/integrase [Aurantimonas coralicida]|uniref:tyrosine-type recombinase/integrase n=1 Tax=Aurantimonas coralicida TaxID=182270 RepID=UPI0024566B55|nr:tyrosine-type recombinase/integrase [Aurantimonas coralicida]